MSYEDLIRFIKENLKVEVSNDCGGDFTVSLRFCGEIISSDYYQANDSKY